MGTYRDPVSHDNLPPVFNTCTGCIHWTKHGTEMPCAECLDTMDGMCWEGEEPDRVVSPQDNGGPPLDDGPIKSDGGSSAYYQLPEGATELNDLIEAKEMSFARGNLFKALYRMGEKDGTAIEYDLNKIELFLGRMRGMLAKGRRL